MIYSSLLPIHHPCVCCCVAAIIVMNDQCLDQSLSCGMDIFHHQHHHHHHHEYQAYLSSSHLVISILESYFHQVYSLNHCQGYWPGHLVQLICFDYLLTRSIKGH